MKEYLLEQGIQENEIDEILSNFDETVSEDDFMEEHIKKILDSLTETEKDAIYRRLWYDHVMQDVKSRMEETKTRLSDTEIKQVAYIYVYEGHYDCNYSYWTNLDILINEVPRFEGKYDYNKNYWENLSIIINKEHMF